jgi:DNA-binding response OmpR family regulator
VTARPSLLLVEDDADLAKVLRGRLAHAGYEVRCAASIAEARAALRAARPDLIVLDVMLPDGSGIDLLRSIRADADLRGLPVLVQTCLGAPARVEEGFEAGANAYLEKPADAARLLAAVRRLLDESRAGGP